MSEERPNPERLLRYAKEEERQEYKGKLKIYLGAAPGVGKTYAMLQDALVKRDQGLDVIIGIVESHGRIEIENLVKHYEVLPRIEVKYHNKRLYDFDLDAALKRNPGLILIDEMAHTNANGLRHNKRWQDIKELIDRGIDVYTTLNVQHIESLNDIVSQIIHTPVKETIPDSMLELAHTIELIDLPPEDLIRRLQEGKVYFPAQIETAKESFFREGNLIALRELALRTTARRVGEQVLLYRHGKGIKHIWPSNDKLLVCINHQPESIKLIRTARRIAIDIKAEWIAVYVDVAQLNSNIVNRNQAIQYLHLAESLGASTQILVGFDIVAEIIQFAREQNVTEIIIGKKIIPRWRALFARSLSDEIIRASQEIDVYVITAGSSRTEINTQIKEVATGFYWPAYLIAGIMTVIAAFTNYIYFIIFNTPHLIIIYILAIAIVAFFGDYGATVLATILTVLTYIYFFVSPYYTFVKTNVSDYIDVTMMIIVAQIIAQLIILNRKQARTTHALHKQDSTLNILTRQLASTRGVDKLLSVGLQYLVKQFNCDALALIPYKGELVVRVRCKTDIELDTKEIGVAHWVYELGQMAGRGTDTLSFSPALYLPLPAAKGTIGVVRIHPIDNERIFTPEEINLLEKCTRQIALAIEVDWAEERAKETRLQKQTDKIRSMLLQTISHDLRLPLIKILANATTINEMSNDLKRSELKKIGNDIYQEADQLDRLISNLLQISYLEDQAINLKKKPNQLRDIITNVVTTSSKKLSKRELIINIEDDLPKIELDSTLIQEVFINLIDNAVKFTPPKTSITINVKRLKNFIQISVEDEGPGIVMDEVNKLFDKFYRGRELTTEYGLGLGLAICKLIIKAHGGRIWAENRKNHVGAAFIFTLPL